MRHVRVLWLDDGQCVLFNALDKRISGRTPAFVGKIAEKLTAGTDMASAIAEVSADSDTRRRITDLLTYIGGECDQEPCACCDNNEKIFGNILALCPSTKCNLRCLYCSGNAGSSINALMDWPLAQAAIDYYFNHAPAVGPYVLQFHGGGEPLCNKGLIKKAIIYACAAAEAKGQTLKTRITTNGFFPENVVRWMADTFDSVSLSFDGPPDIHNRQRPAADGKNSYDTVLRTLRILENEGMPLRINTVITTYGIDRMEEIIRHIRSVSKTTELRLLPMEYCGRCKESGIDALDFGQYARNFEKILPVAGSLNFELLSAFELSDRCADVYCQACGFMICVAPHGRISTCIEVMDETSGVNELLIGRYDTGKIVIDWDAVIKLRSRTYHNLEPCVECVFRTNCAGNCLVRAGRKNGTVMSVDRESCLMTKKTLTQYFTNIADSIEDFMETEYYSLVPESLTGDISVSKSR